MLGPWPETKLPVTTVFLWDNSLLLKQLMIQFVEIQYKEKLKYIVPKLSS